MSSQTQKPFHKLLTKIETMLLDYYQIEQQAEIVHHLVDRQAIESSMPADHPELKADGSLWIEQTEDETFLGVTFQTHIEDCLSENLIENGINNNNLNALLVAVEEVSHFCLVTQRLSQSESVSKLELEWQGEIDKLMTGAQLLEQLYGDPHVLPLARKLFDEARITGEDQGLYREATKHAAHFCFRAIDSQWQHPRSFQSLLQKAYRLSWQGKLDLVRQIPAGWREAS